ncbi:MAG: ATP-dependent DNA helicase RecG [Succinivibrio sp.]|nr:ATP-dependent DNA helicase RecG [Succinivibrio sp.]
MADDSYYHTTAVTTLKGVGARLGQKYAEKGVNSLFDLLLYLPFRYLDKTHLTPLSLLPRDGQPVLVQATIIQTKLNQTSRFAVLNVELQDSSGRGRAVFFNVYPSMVKKMAAGQNLTLFGVARPDRNGVLCLQHPEVKYGWSAELDKTLTPIYHGGSEMKQANLRKMSQQVLSKLRTMPLLELLPAELNPYALSLSEALQEVHYPLPDPQGGVSLICQKPSFLRLVYEELLAYQCSLLALKRLNLQRQSPRLAAAPQLIEQFLHTLSFSLTGAQLRASQEIAADLERSTPMLRLLHGDVGSGKTLVAMLACLQACAHGYQSVLLAPTEILALQHYQNFNRLLSPLKIRVVVLHSSQNKAVRTETLEQIASGQAQIIIGTHSVFQKGVTYQNLALAIIDEQHRFGIEQRVALLQKAPEGTTLHQLIMTATPIPRTQQLALFADLDVSTLDELPAGRKSIITSIHRSRRRTEIIEHVRKVLGTGVQVYWICPRIEDNEEDDTASVLSLYQEITRQLAPYRVDILHGQLQKEQKELAMQKFLEHDTDVLVATTIVEVGVDVPNANIIIIENATQLGLAQLHQLRGRVGRGQAQAYCLLIYNENATENNDIALQRLEVMKSTNDGFKIAEADLKLRGPGEVFGTRQTGFNTFKIADVVRDQDLILPARRAAEQIISKDPVLSKRLIERWFPNFISS